MKIWKFTIAVSIYILAFSLLIFFVPNSLPNRRAEWAQPPMVFICSDSNYSKKEVDSAIHYWERLGYAFGEVVDDINCSSGYAKNSIVITIPSSSSGFSNPSDTQKIGKTTSVVDLKNKLIHSAVIEVMIKRDRVLEHEIGHALGWEDFSDISHIMHPNHNNGGWDGKGLAVH